MADFTYTEEEKRVIREATGWDDDKIRLAEVKKIKPSTIVALIHADTYEKMIEAYRVVANDPAFPRSDQRNLPRFSDLYSKSIPQISADQDAVKKDLNTYEKVSLLHSMVLSINEGYQNDTSDIVTNEKTQIRTQATQNSFSHSAGWGLLARIYGVDNAQWLADFKEKYHDKLPNWLDENVPFVNRDNTNPQLEKRQSSFDSWMNEKTFDFLKSHPNASYQELLDFSKAMIARNKSRIEAYLSDYKSDFVEFGGDALPEAMSATISGRQVSREEFQRMYASSVIEYFGSNEGESYLKSVTSYKVSIPGGVYDSKDLAFLSQNPPAIGDAGKSEEAKVQNAYTDAYLTAGKIFDSSLVHDDPQKREEFLKNSQYEIREYDGSSNNYVVKHTVKINTDRAVVIEAEKNPELQSAYKQYSDRYGDLPGAMTQTGNTALSHNGNKKEKVSSGVSI